MELRHLRYFVAVAEELHFGRAAERLCIAQPPLSQQIQQLEAELGFALFTRTSRKVELTTAGRIYLEEVRSTMSNLDRAASDARRAARGEVGRLAIGFVGTAAYSVLPPSLRMYRQMYPDVHLSLRELASARQALALREGRIQIGFARPTLTAPDLTTEIALSEPFVAAVPASHRYAQRTDLAIRDLCDEDFVLFPRLPKPSYGDLLIRLCEEHGFRPNVVQEVIEIQTALSLVAGGLGITLVPRSAAAIRWPGVAFASFSEPAPHTHLGVVYRSGDISPIVDGFLRVVRSLKVESATTDKS